MKINFESDFDVILRLKACDGDKCTNIGWPLYDWTAKFYTNDLEHTYVASSLGGVLTNCFDDNGQIHVVFNNHGLSTGTLRVKFRAEIPNDIYPDGKKLEVCPQPLDVELVRGMGDCGTVKTEAIAPTQKWRGRDSLTGIVLRRGFMSNFSQPYEVYCGKINQFSSNFAIKIKFHKGESKVDVTSIFGDLFQPKDIVDIYNGTYEIVNGRVIVRANENDYGCKTVLMLFLLNVDNIYLTKNSRGQIIATQRLNYDYMKATPTKPDTLTIKKEPSGSPYYFVTDSHGNRYELQYKKCKRRAVCESKQSKAFHYIYRKKWRRITNLKEMSLDGVYKKSCVIRVRRVSDKAKGDWVYGRLRKNLSGGTYISWI